MKKNIFEPLGMNDTGFARTPDVFSRVASEYEYLPKEDTIKELDKERNFSVFGSEYESGGAGIISTAKDQAILADALAMRGVGSQSCGPALDKKYEIPKEGRNIFKFIF